jgi:C4-dicarboxylate transporter DctM subunit
MTEDTSVMVKTNPVLAFLDKAIYRANREAARVCGILLLLIAFFVFATVIGRFSGFPISELFSITIMSLIVFGFLALGHTLGEGKHCTVDFITERVPENTRFSLEILGHAFMVVFATLWGWQGANWALRLFERGTLTSGSASLGEISIPYGILPGIMALGCLLLVLQALRLIFKRWQSLKGKYNFMQCAFPVILVVVLAAAGIAYGIMVSPIAGLFITLMVFLFMGQPVALALGFTGMIGLFLFAGGYSGLLQVPLMTFKMVESYPLVALPLYVIIGTIMGEAKLIDRLFVFLDHWMGRIPGSLLMVTIATGAVICAITGSSIAATAILSLVCIPPLLERKYDKRLSMGVVAAGSVGTLIPPSTALIVYGILVEQSIGRLFMAAVLPAAITFIMFGIYLFILSYTNREKFGLKSPPVDWNTKLTSFTGSIPLLLLPVVILGGIYVGIFTATEAAGVAVVYGLLVSIVSGKKFSWKDLSKGLDEGTLLSSMVLFVIFGGILFASVTSQLRLGQVVVSFVQSAGLSTAAVLVIMYIILFIMGMFMPNSSIMLITVPIFFPLSKAFGIDPYLLGMVYVFCGEIGLLTPPVGINLFVMQGVSKMSLYDVSVGCAPFVIILTIALLVTCVFPELVTWLPSTMK